MSTDPQRYPNHLCECDDTDLSQATHPVLSPNGFWVQITCGEGHRRSIPKTTWEAELRRRQAVQVGLADSMREGTP